MTLQAAQAYAQAQTKTPKIDWNKLLLDTAKNFDTAVKPQRPQLPEIIEQAPKTDGKVTEETTKDKEPDPQPEKTNWFKKNWYYVAGAVVLIIIVVIYATSNTKKKTK